MTNYEKIKAMSVEEMAHGMYKTLTCECCPTETECMGKAVSYCFYELKKWLLQEAEE